MSIERLHHTLQSGKVLRYHAAPSVTPQSLAHHQWGVAALVMELTNFNCSAMLLAEALLHDTGELTTGDIPYTLKRDNPSLKALVKDLEFAARRDFTLCAPLRLTEQEHAVLKMADTLEGLLWCCENEKPPQVVRSRWITAYHAGIVKFKGEHPGLTHVWDKAEQMFIKAIKQ